MEPVLDDVTEVFTETPYSDVVLEAQQCTEQGLNVLPCDNVMKRTFGYVLEKDGVLLKYWTRDCVQIRKDLPEDCLLNSYIRVLLTYQSGRQALVRSSNVIRLCNRLRSDPSIEFDLPSPEEFGQYHEHAGRVLESLS